jgi:cell volume regulation protein A
MDVVYVVGPILLIAIVLVAVWLDRFSVPVILIALGAGIVFGSDVLGIWHFDDIELTKQVANFALVFILFYGGFVTRQSDFKAVALRAGGLATWGVILTALGTFGVLYGLFNWQLEKALLLAVIISSTDAAAIMSILRRQPLPPKLSSTVKIESAANDPMAVLLTVAVVEAIASGQTAWLTSAAVFAWRFTAAPLIGWALTHGALWLFNRLKPQDRGLYYVFSLATILLIYGLAEMINASGMLAVFVAGYVMGNSPFVYKQGVSNFTSALSTVANIGMFALLGLQVFPHQWADLWLDGILLFLALTFFARPFAVFLGTTGMGIGWKDKTFISWAGLRGSVPIVLATYPAAAGLAIGEEIFSLVFFAVLLSIAVQGSTMGWLARLLKQTVPARPSPMFNVELVTLAESDYDLIVVDLPGPRGAVGPEISDLRFPEGSVIILITRGKELVVPKGGTRLEGWDQLTVLVHAKDQETVRSVLLNAFSPNTIEGKDHETIQEHSLC